MTPVRTACLLFAVLFVITGIVYPLAVTLVAGFAFPENAGGSLIRTDLGVVIGSKRIGQDFSDPRYFRGRPSATQGTPFNASASGGSNLGPTNPKLLDVVRERIVNFRSSGIEGPLPADLVMASGSGLDPHIGLESALLQVPVIARARNLSEARLTELVYSEIEADPLSPPHVNVLSLNMALDQLPEG